VTVTAEVMNVTIDNRLGAREAWLEAAIEALRPRFVEVGYPLPDVIHISIGFAYGAKAESRFVLGQTWRSDMSDDGANHIFMAPFEGDPVSMLATLVHELIHVALDCEDGHRGRFAEVATRLGFVGKLTTVNPNEILAAEMMTLAGALGPMPHAKLSVDGPVAKRRGTPDGPQADDDRPANDPTHTGPKKQVNRQLKMVAPDCGYVIRTARKWVVEVGAPKCPHGVDMVPDGWTLDELTAPPEGEDA
jgi:hypothetical protein